MFKPGIVLFKFVIQVIRLFKIYHYDCFNGLSNVVQYGAISIFLMQIATSVVMMMGKLQV